jgi:hypothetical protein
MPHLVSVVTDLKERGIHFKSIHDGVMDTTSASGELIFNVSAALARFESSSGKGASGRKKTNFSGQSAGQNGQKAARG